MLRKLAPYTRGYRLYVLLGVLCAVLGIGGFLLARRAWKRLQYLRDHPEE